MTPALDGAAAQAAYYDSITESEWEIERPSGAPAFHYRTLTWKLTRSLAGLGPLPPRSTALVVCAGSGMDAEFLVRRGFDVTATDVSSGALERAAERVRRHGVTFRLRCAPVERLPYPDRAFDLVYVHDGLHHLGDPLLGLREMARVAGSALSVNEPASAFITQVAVALGLAEEVEDAGNRVARVCPRRATALLQSLGFAVVYSERYLMRYQHTPGRAARLLSTPGVLPAAWMAFLALNRVAGSCGNKFSIQALRTAR